MNINDLQAGYLVKLREKGFGAVATNSELVKLIIYQDFSYDNIEDWNEDLTERNVPSYDIVEVYKPKTNKDILSTLDDYELIWKESSSKTQVLEACEAIEKKYNCRITCRRVFRSCYSFELNCVNISSTFTLLVSECSLQDLVDRLSKCVEDAIISHYKNKNM